ncbi:MAG TPA: pitrilysin family protein, partial [Afifellaceae bacterium]|nr:pitrilysin family protein [Afifellaceae bacterium]
FKGTEEHPEGAFSQIVATIGGEENAFTSSDYTGYYQRVAREHLGDMMRLEADRMANLTLTEEDMAAERDVVVEERLEVIESDPAALLEEAMDAVLYRNHPYRRPVIGWMHEIEALDRDTALAFYNRYYAPNNALLVVAGDVSPDEVRRLASSTYGRVPANPARVRAARPAEPPQVGARTVTVRHERVREPLVQRTYLVPSSRTATAGDAEALQVLADILGRGATSRLRDRLVRGAGPAIEAGAYYDSERVDDTPFVIYGVPKDGISLRRLETELERIVAEVNQGGVTEAELARAKNSVVAEAIYSQDSQETLAQSIGTSLVVGHSLEHVQTWPRRIGAVTAQDLQAVARRYLGESRAVTGYLEPQAGDKR